MEKMIACLNISHYKMKLVTEQDEAKRQIVLRLLAEEEAKLAALDDPPKRIKARELAVLPFSPVGRLNVDPLRGFRFDPTAKDAVARKSSKLGF